MSRSTERTRDQFVGLCEETEVPELAAVRRRIEAQATAALQAGIWTHRGAWQRWLRLVSWVSRWVADRPELPMRREVCDNPKYAHTGTTRREVAMALATRWERRNGIHRHKSADGGQVAGTTDAGMSGEEKPDAIREDD